MDNTTHLEKIKELLTKLHLGFEYMQNNPDKVVENEGLLERAKPIIKELVELGVPEDHSLGVLILGGIIDDKLIESYKEKIPS